MTSAVRPAVIFPATLREPPGINGPAARRPPVDGAAASAGHRRPGQIRRVTPARAEELIRVHATAARIASARMTATALEMLRESVDDASSLPTRPGWERKAAAHAEIFRLLGAIAGARAAVELDGAAVLIRDLMSTVGPAANGMIMSSRARLLEHLGTGNAAAAEREVETHLRVLHYMWRLARPLSHGCPG